MAYEVKDIKLAPQGLKNIGWAEAQMGALLKVRERFEKEKPISGYRIGMALHVTKETAVLVRTLVAGGAEVAITSCNPLSTQDDAAAALASEGVNVFAYKGENIEDYYRFLDQVIDFKPQITIDDGMDLVTRVHTKYPQLLSDMICGCEETTTGVIRLRAMEEEGALEYPIIAVNDCQTKHLMDNYYGTGQSSLDGVIRATNLLISGKTVVVAGYGNCGKGVALRAKGLGANIIVTEIDPFRALQAKMDGYRVMKMEQAVREGDIFITVSGNLHAISSEHIRLMKDGVVLANSGHFDHEIDVAGLKQMASDVQRIRPLFDQYIVENKRIYLCGEGRLVNLACAEGHPSTVMSLSFCDQSLGVEWGIRNRESLRPKVYKLPQEIDQTVARFQLEAMEVSIDELTPEQREYLTSWQTGT